MSLDALFQRALQLHSAGQRAEAERLYRRILAAAPKAAPPLFFLGLLEAQGGNAAGFARMEKALRLAPGNAGLWQNYAVTLADAGRIAEAARAFERCLALDPGNAEACLGLGNVARLTGDVAAAAAHYRRAIALNPSALGARINLGTLLSEHGDGDHEEGLRILEEAAAAAPDDPVPQLNHAASLAFHDRAAEARQALTRLAARHPSAFAPLWRRLHALPLVYESLAEVEAARRRWADDLGRIEETLDLSSEARIGEAFEELRVATNFLLPYQGVFPPPLDEANLQRRLAAVVARIVRARLPRFAAPLPRPPSRRRIRVGFLSHYFRHHSILKTHGAWLTGLNRRRFEVIAVHTGPADEATRRLAGRCETFLHRPAFTPSLLDELRALALDVAIFPDLGMEPLYQVLAALRLAPVQCNGLGHPVTSGFDSIDFALSSALMEPQDGQRHYSENLVLLPNAAYAYARPPLPTGGTGFERGPARFIYACTQNLAKLLPDQDAVFARLAAAVPEAELWFIAARSPVATEHFRARLAAAFAREGAAASRIRILPRMDQATFLATCRAADAFLDGHAWSGCNTTYEALAAGRPVVTLPGGAMRARHAAAILRLGGLDELVTSDAEGFVATAARLARDAAWREALGRAVIDAQARIYDDPAPVAALASFLEAAASTRG
jgi:predicted O-linked N-acetylglucosamine transferase (SPINDLY family)